MRKVFVKQFPGDFNGEINAQEWLQEIFNTHPNDNIQILCELAAVSRGIDLDRFVWYTIIVTT